MHDHIKNLRLEIDAQLNGFSHILPSREVSLAYTHLQRAKMWLGKCMGELGTPTPYPNSESPENPTIEPQAEHTPASIQFEGMGTHLARVKHFRAELQKTVDKMEVIHRGETPGRDFSLYFTQSYLSIQESKMWFGWELDRIRKIQEPTPGLEGGLAITPLPLF